MVALNQQNPLLEMSILRTTCPTKSSKNVHTDPTEAEAAMVEAVAMVAVEAVAMVAVEAAATAVAEATVEAAEEDTVAAETADATSTKREYQPSVANISLFFCYHFLAAYA
jgi:hypothetical protein